MPALTSRPTARALVGLIAVLLLLGLAVPTSRAGGGGGGGVTAVAGPVTLSAISINGAATTVQVSALSAISISVHYAIVDKTCPGCIDEIQVGFRGQKPATCIYQGTPGGDGEQGDVRFTLHAPARPGRYDLVVARAQDYSCPKDWWPNAAIGTFGTVSVVAGTAVPAPVSTSPITISDVSLNGSGNAAVVAAGTELRISLHYEIVDTGCQDCIDEIQIGFGGRKPSTCIYQDIPGSDGAQGNAHFTLRVPVKPGRYDLVFARAQDYSCPSGWWPNAAVGRFGSVTVTNPRN